MYFLHLILGKTIGHLRRYFLFPAPACSLHLILRGKWESADVKTFFFGLHLILRGKLDVSEREDFVFVFHLTFGVMA